MSPLHVWGTAGDPGGLGRGGGVFAHRLIIEWRRVASKPVCYVLRISRAVATDAAHCVFDVMLGPRDPGGGGGGGVAPAQGLSGSVLQLPLTHQQCSGTRVRTGVRGWGSVMKLHPISRWRNSRAVAQEGVGLGLEDSITNNATPCLLPYSAMFLNPRITQSLLASLSFAVWCAHPCFYRASRHTGGLITAEGL